MNARPSFPTVPLAQVPAENIAGTLPDHLPLLLIVDDERVVADTLSTIFDLNGYAVMTAYDAGSAYEIALLAPPELLITDVSMPHMNGIDLAIKIRLGAPDCEVILFSGQDVVLPLQLKAGRPGNSFIALKKPMAPDLLLHRVAACLRHREATPPASRSSAASHASDASDGSVSWAKPGEHCRAFRPRRQADSHKPRPH